MHTFNFIYSDFILKQILLFTFFVLETKKVAKLHRCKQNTVNPFLFFLLQHSYDIYHSWKTFFPEGFFKYLIPDLIYLVLNKQKAGLSVNFNILTQFLIEHLCLIYQQNSTIILNLNLLISYILLYFYFTQDKCLIQLWKYKTTEKLQHVFCLIYQTLYHSVIISHLPAINSNFQIYVNHFFFPQY